MAAVEAFYNTIDHDQMVLLISIVSGFILAGALLFASLFHELAVSAHHIAVRNQNAHRRTVSLIVSAPALVVLASSILLR